LTGKKNELIIQQFKNGAFITSYNSFKINLIDLPFKIKEIEIDNEIVPIKNLKPNGNNTIHITKEFTVLHITGK